MNLHPITPRLVAAAEPQVEKYPPWLSLLIILGGGALLWAVIIAAAWLL